MSGAGGGLLLASALVDHEDYAPASEGRLGAGIALATVAATGAPAALVACGVDFGGDLPGAGTIFVCLSSVLATAGVAAGGVVLWAQGAADGAGESDVELSLDAGPGGARVKGTW